MDANLLETPLAALHRRLGARMVPFAGYAMPVQYPAGIIAEHKACREGAALFDVSHMGQAVLNSIDGAHYMERILCGDIQGLAMGRQRYSLLMNEAGGIDDDLMIANLGVDGNDWVDVKRFFIVVNAANKKEDFHRIIAAVSNEREWRAHRLTVRDQHALLALQGPKAAGILGEFCAAATTMQFMSVLEITIAGRFPAIIARSGYTGEDGYEISVAGKDAEPLAEMLIAAGAVPAGLGARDSLRLEAGLCLHGNDIGPDTNPVEAGLMWTIPKRRRARWDFVGADAVRTMLENGPPRRRVGFRVNDKAPVRAGTAVVAPDGRPIGTVTSGVPSPTLGYPIAMGYVETDHAADGTRVAFAVRGRLIPGTVVPMPFVPHRYVR